MTRDYFGLAVRLAKERIQQPAVKFSTVQFHRRGTRSEWLAEVSGLAIPAGPSWSRVVPQVQAAQEAVTLLCPDAVFLNYSTADDRTVLLWFVSEDGPMLGAA